MSCFLNPKSGCIVYVVALFVNMLFATVCVAQNSNGKSDFATGNENISMRIDVYENAVAELQQRPFENKSLAHIMTELGNLYSAEEDFPKAINIYMRSIFLREFNSRGKGYDKTDIAWQFIEVGNSFIGMQDFQLAEYVYRKALQYFVLADDNLGIITALNNIGICLYNTNRSNKALEVFSITRYLSNKTNDSNRIFTSTIYYCRLISKMGRHSEAIHLLEGLANENTTQVDGLLNEFRIYQLADIYRASGNMDKAIECYQLLASSQLEGKSDYYKCSASIELASISEKRHNNSDAIKYASEAYNALQRLHHVSLSVEVNFLLYKLYKITGNTALALKHFEEYHEAVLKVNRREVVLFANDYKRKMERIAISQDISRLREQNNKALSEKSNQKNLSIFLIVVASLLLIMLFTVRGFDTRLQLLADHVNTFSITQKLLLLVVACLYFIGYYYFFIPIDKSDIVKNMSVLCRLWPGLIAGGVSLGTVFFYNKIVAARQPEMNWYKYSIFASAITFFAVFVAQLSYFLFFGLSGVNFFLSLSLIILASFILPLYISIFIIENLFARHFEAVLLSLSKNINQIKQKVVPEKRQIVLKSEKTTSVLAFNVSDLLIAEAQGNYCKFYLKQGDIVVRKLFLITMKSTNEQLDSFKSIVRCHKSYMVNIHHVASVSGKSKGYFLRFDTDVEPVPISRSFQKEVLTTIDSFQSGIS